MGGCQGLGHRVGQALLAVQLSVGEAGCISAAVGWPSVPVPVRGGEHENSH